MVCSRINLGDGNTAIVCRRGGAAKKCSEPLCTRKATKLCDYQVGHNGKTCDRDLCAAHAFKPPADKTADVDFCGPHARIVGIIETPAVRP